MRLQALSIISALLLCSISHALAQKSDKIEQARYQFISQKIELTAQQELTFWPVYNNYLDKKLEIKKQIRNLRTDNFSKSATDVMLTEDLNKYFLLKKKEVDIEQEYYQRFMKILSPRQSVELLKAERDFVILLYKKLEE